MKKRIISILLVLVMTVSLLPQLIFVADAEDSDVEIARWSGFRKTAVCFTFDDGAVEQRSHCTSIAPAFDKYGYKATFYVVTSTNWTDSAKEWAEYKKLANNGHEIGSHSVTHSIDNDSSELGTSKGIIENNIGKPCLTYSYVNGLVPYGTVVLNYYIAAREIGDGLNWSSNPDCGRINSQILGSEGLNTKTAITGKIQNAIDSDQWVTFVGHGIHGVTSGSSYSPLSYDALTGSLDWIHEHDNEVWATSLCNAVMYLKERDDATFKQTSATDTELTYSLTLSSKLTVSKICKWNYPLSLRISLPRGWETVSVTQDGKTLDSYIKEGKIYFDAVPNGGEITLKRVNEVTTYDLWVGGVRVTSANKDNILGDSGTPTATFDPVKSELTLNNATITNVHSDDSINAAVYSGETLTVVLKGSNIVSPASSVDACGFYSDYGDLTLTGSGDVDIKSYDAGIYAYEGDVVISGSGDVTIESEDDYGICADNNVTVCGDGDLTVKSYYCGIYACDGDVVISGSGDVTIESEDDYGICADNNVTVCGDGDLTVKSYYSGILTYDGDVVISGSGDVTIEAEDDAGICADNNVTVSGDGNLIVTSNKHGIYTGRGSITISGGGNRTLYSTYGSDNDYYRAVYSYQGDIDISGTGTLTIASAPGSSSEYDAGLYSYWGSLSVSGSVVLNISDVNYGTYSDEATFASSGEMTVDASVWGVSSSDDIIFSGSGKATISGGKYGAYLFDSGKSVLLNGTGTPISLTAGEGYTAVWNNADSSSPVGGTNFANYDVTGAPNTASVVYTLKSGTPATEYDLWVGGVRVTSANKDNILGDSDTPTATFDSVKGELTLNNASLSTGYEYSTGKNALIYSKDMDLTIKAADGLTLNNSTGSGVYVDEGALTIEGSVTGTTTYYGIYASSDITVKGDVDLTGSSAYRLIESYGKVEITGKAKLSGRADHGIYARNEISVGGNVTMGTFTYGLYSLSTVTVNGSVTGTTTYYALSDITVRGDVDLTGSSANSLIESYGKVEITGKAKLSGSANYYGIYARNEISVGGNVTMGTFKYGLYSGNSTVAMVSGIWDITATEYAIYARNGITIPVTHFVTTPEDGVITEITVSLDSSYYTVTESDGETPAKHVVIERSYTVTFNMNGHGTQVADQTVEDGSKATKPADPTAEGWTFGGWYADATFSAAFDFNTAITADTTVYAKWTDDTTPSILWGDANGDGTVDSKDLSLLRKYMASYDYTTGISTVAVQPGADANGDGTIDSKDLSLLRKYMASYDYTTGTSTVVLGPSK